MTSSSKLPLTLASSCLNKSKSFGAGLLKTCSCSLRTARNLSIPTPSSKNATSGSDVLDSQEEKWRSLEDRQPELAAGPGDAKHSGQRRPPNTPIAIIAALRKTVHLPHDFQEQLGRQRGSRVVRPHRIVRRHHSSAAARLGPFDFPRGRRRRIQLPIRDSEATAVSLDGRGASQVVRLRHRSLSK